jgi:VanZ family protein
MSQRPFRAKPVLVALGGYAAAVATVALWPTPVDRPVSGVLRRVLSRLHEHGVPSWFDYSFVEFSANVAMFVPLGFLLAALFNRRLTWAAVVVAGMVSAAIEIAQWALLPARYPTVNDVLANTMGAAIGALLLAVLTLDRAARSD